MVHFNGTEAQPANQPELQQPASRSAAIRLLATLGIRLASLTALASSAAHSASSALVAASSAAASSTPGTLAATPRLASSMSPDEIRNLVLAATAIGGLIAFCIGLWQYHKAQAWKRVEFASSVLDKLRDDAGLRLALFFLDWHDREVNLPEEYSGYTTDKKPFLHSLDRLAVAYSMESRQIILETSDYELRPEFRKSEYLLYIDVLDRLFEYLSQVQEYIEMKLLRR